MSNKEREDTSAPAAPAATEPAAAGTSAAGGSAAAEPAADAAGSERPRRRRRRWPWIIAALLIASVIGLRAALPTIIERGAAYGSRYWLGLPVRIDNVDLDLFQGSVTVEGVSVASRPDEVEPTDAAMNPPPIDAGSALLHLDRIAARLSWSALRDSTVLLQELVVEKPSVRVEREADGSIDPLRHARPLAPPSAPEEEQPSEPSAWKYLVQRFALGGPDVRVIDPASGENLLEFGLEDFSLDDVAVEGSKLGLGNLGIRGPKLRIRRDLVVRDTPAPVAATEPPPKAANAAAADAVAAGAAPKTAEGAAADAATTPPKPADAANADAAATSKPDAAPAAAPARPAAAPAQAGYSLDKIHIERAALTWITADGPVDVALALDATGITADEGKTFPLDLKLEIKSGRIALQGEVGILPPSYKGTVSWSGLPFPPLLLASVPQFAPWLRAANSTAELRIDGDFAGAKGPPAMQVAGNVSIDAVAVSDPLGQEVAIGWKQLEVAISKADVPIPEEGKPARSTIVALDRLRLIEPKISYTRPSPALDKLLGIQPVAAAPELPADKAGAAKAGATSGTAAPAKPATAAAKAAPASDKAAAAKPGAASDKPVVVTAQEKPAPVPAGPAPVVLSIASLELAGADIEGFDKTLDPPGHTRIRELSLTASNVQYPDAAASDVRLAGILPESAKLTVQGDLRPGNQGDFTVVLDRFDLPTIGPFAIPYGANLQKGQFSTKTKIKLRGAKIEITNDLLLHELALSLQDPKTFESSFGVPIDLALALLRDPAGNIRLSIPVKIDEKGAQVPIAAILASAIRQALVGAVTAPLKMVGAVFSGLKGDKDGAPFSFDPVASRPGSAEPADGAGGRIDGIVKLLKDRPALGLELQGRTGAEDVPLVAEQILIELHENDKDLPEVTDSGFLARRRIGQALDRRAKGQDAKLSAEDRALYDRYIAAVQVPPARLAELANSRAQRVRALLLEKGVAAGRVHVGEPAPVDKPGVVLGFRPG